MFMKTKRFTPIKFIALSITAALIFIGCGSDVTVCDCLRDDGTHKKECDRLGNSMTDEQMSSEIRKCK